MDMFHLVGVAEQEGFPDGWRIFGRDILKPINEWAEDNRLKKAYKHFFLSGGKMTRGIDLLLFNGKQLL